MVQKQKLVNLNFEKEMASRGFPIGKDNGGSVISEFRFSWVVKHNPHLYQVVHPHENAKITVITPEKFLETVNKIENRLKYKLFG